MKVAVVMPVYNSERYLFEAINSILSQTYRNFTLVAVDDGSTDGSLQLLKNAALVDERMVVLAQQNKGVSAARNLALEYLEASGDFDLLCFFDSDDVVYPDFLETYVRLKERYDADYIVSGFFRWFKHSKIQNEDSRGESYFLEGLESLSHFSGDSGLRKLAPEASSNLLAHRCFSSSVVYGMRFRQDLRVCEDQEFILRALLKVKRGVLSRRVTYLYRQRGRSLSRDVAGVDSEIKFMRLLFRMYESGNEKLKQVLLLYVVRLWWATVRKVYENDLAKEYKEDLRKIFYKIKKCGEVQSLPKRYAKRIFICGFGEMVLCCYFWVASFRKKRGGNQEVFE